MRAHHSPEQRSGRNAEIEDPGENGHRHRRSVFRRAPDHFRLACDIECRSGNSPHRAQREKQPQVNRRKVKQKENRCH